MYSFRFFSPFSQVEVWRCTARIYVSFRRTVLNSPDVQRFETYLRDRVKLCDVNKESNEELDLIESY